MESTVDSFSARNCDGHHVSGVAEFTVTGYIVRRLWQSVLVLFAVSLLSFVLIFLSGDPVAAWCR